MKVIDTAFEIGDIVYIRTDTEQLPRQVYCYLVFRNDVIYKCACGTIISEHYEFELSTEANVMIKQ